MAMRRKRISASRCASIPVMSCPFMKRLYSAAKDGCAIAIPPFLKSLQNMIPKKPLNIAESISNI